MSSNSASSIYDNYADLRRAISCAELAHRLIGPVPVTDLQFDAQFRLFRQFDVSAAMLRSLFRPCSRAAQAIQYAKENGTPEAAADLANAFLRIPATVATSTHLYVLVDDKQKTVLSVDSRRPRDATTLLPHLDYVDRRDRSFNFHFATFDESRMQVMVRYVLAKAKWAYWPLVHVSFNAEPTVFFRAAHGWLDHQQQLSYLSGYFSSVASRSRNDTQHRVHTAVDCCFSWPFALNSVLQCQQQLQAKLLRTHGTSSDVIRKLMASLLRCDRHTFPHRRLVQSACDELTKRFGGVDPWQVISEFDIVQAISRWATQQDLSVREAAERIAADYLELRHNLWSREL